MRIVRKMLLFLLLHSLVGFGQEAPPLARMIGKVPFEVLTGGVVIVRGNINQLPDTLNFILDTGSGGISLDSATCEALGLRLQPSDRVIKGIGGVRKVKFLNEASIQLVGGIRADSLNFHVNDYEILSSVYGIKIDGIIGYSFLSRYIVQLDYDSTQMLVYTQGRMAYPKGGFLLKPYLGVIPIQEIAFADDRRMLGRFYFDTGAGLSFLLTRNYSTDSAVMRKKKPPVVRTQAEGVGGRTDMELTTVQLVKLGPYRFRNVPTYIFDDPYNIISYPELAGLIGNDLLRRFNTILNYQKREFHLIPNSHMRDLFDYSYTGLGLYFIDGRVIVEDVVKGSPGDVAGFQTGDVVFGVDRNFSNNIQQYKNLLQTTGSKVKVVVIRHNNLLELFIRPRNIMKRR